MDNMKLFIKQVFSYKKHHIIALICLILSAVTALLLPIINMQVLDNAIANKNLDLLKILILSYLVIAILDKLLKFCSDYQYTIISRKLVTDLKVQIFNRLHNLSGKFFSDEKSGNIFTVITEDITIVQNIASKTLFQMISEIIIAIPLSIYLFTIDIQLFILIAAPLPLFFILQYYFINITEKRAKSCRTNVSKLNVILQEFLSAPMTNIIIGGSSYFKSTFKNQAQETESTYIKFSGISLLRNFTINSMLVISNILILLIGGYKVINDILTIGALITIIQYYTRIVLPIFKMADFISELKVTLISLNRIYDILNKPSCIINSGIEITDINDIELEDISFRYNEEQTPQCLDHVSVNFHKNTFIALVGDSGSGKSTIINLLFHLWKVDSGSIKINKVDIEKLNTEEIRDQISVVSQQNVLFNDSIINNITLLDSKIQTEEVIEVCRNLGIHEYIDSLPQKYDSNVGDNGIKLSGGQKQRIAIARAILKKSSVLIFDEATSNLDTITEEKIVNYVEKISSGRIIIFIAHRLSTIVKADYIYVFKNGNIIEQGTHDSLLKLRKHYYRLFFNDMTDGSYPLTHNNQS